VDKKRSIQIHSKTKLILGFFLVRQYIRPHLWGNLGKVGGGGSQTTCKHFVRPANTNFEIYNIFNIVRSATQVSFLLHSGTVCTDCNAGKYSDASGSTCNSCPANIYQPEDGQGWSASSCEICDTGKYSEYFQFLCAWQSQAGGIPVGTDRC
jgi:hypothetical protein